MRRARPSAALRRSRWWLKPGAWSLEPEARSAEPLRQWMLEPYL